MVCRLMTDQLISDILDASPDEVNMDRLLFDFPEIMAKYRKPTTEKYLTTFHKKVRVNINTNGWRSTSDA